MNETKQTVEDWLSELQTISRSLRESGIGKVSESFQLSGYSFKITLGVGESINLQYPNGVGYSGYPGDRPRRFGADFRKVYTQNYEEFINVKEILKKKGEDLADATNELFKAILHKEIPELMLERLLGTHISEKPGDQLIMVAGKRAQELLEIMTHHEYISALNWQGTVGSKILTVNYYTSDSNYYWRLNWGDLRIENGQDFHSSIANSILLISNFEKIAEVLRKLNAIYAETNEKLKIL